jgi:putative membrane protein
MKLLIRLLINAAALYAAAELVGGISLEGSFGTILIVALIFGVINAIVRPILTIFSLPFIVVTLGLFLLVINALMLMLTASLSSALYVEGFGAALLGSLVISVVSWFLGVFLKDDDKRRKDRD